MAAKIAEQMITPRKIKERYEDFNFLLSKQLDCLRRINHQLYHSPTNIEPLYMKEYEFIKPIIEEYKSLVNDFESVCALRDRFIEKHPNPECSFIEGNLKEIYKHSFSYDDTDCKQNYLDHLNRIINY